MKCFTVDPFPLCPHPLMVAKQAFTIAATWIANSVPQSTNASDDAAPWWSHFLAYETMYFVVILRQRQNGHRFANGILNLCSCVSKYFHYYSNVIEICSHGSHKQYCSTYSGNGFVPNRRWAIISTNDCLVWLRIYALLGLIEEIVVELNHFHKTLIS